MGFLELPGGGTHQPSSDARRGGRTQVDKADDDLISFLLHLLRAGLGDALGDVLVAQEGLAEAVLVAELCACINSPADCARDLPA